MVPQFVLEMPLVKNISFRILNEKYYTEVLVRR